MFEKLNWWIIIILCRRKEILHVKIKGESWPHHVLRLKVYSAIVSSHNLSRDDKTHSNTSWVFKSFKQVQLILGLDSCSSIRHLVYQLLIFNIVCNWDAHFSLLCVVQSVSGQINGDSLEPRVVSNHLMREVLTINAYLQLQTFDLSFDVHHLANFWDTLRKVELRGYCPKLIVLHLIPVLDVLYLTDHEIRQHPCAHDLLSETLPVSALKLFEIFTFLNILARLNNILQRSPYFLLEGSTNGSF